MKDEARVLSLMTVWVIRREGKREEKGRVIRKGGKGKKKRIARKGLYKPLFPYCHARPYPKLLSEILGRFFSYVMRLLFDRSQGSHQQQQIVLCLSRFVHLGVLLASH